ncbi:MAG TPA: PBP1A family penicillin-binding protein [Aliidongia sp.]|nr:PBP1A family penicillin-binding protein [Aliidongia sp.]
MPPESAAPRRRWPWFLAKWSAVVAVWGLLLVFCLAVGLWAGLPDTSELGRTDRHPSVTLRAEDGSLIATFGDLYGEPLTIAELPKALPQAVIATEDRRFYSHFGIDLIGILRAAFANLRAGHVVQGGSTITQQLAKNLFLTPDRTMLRKAQEMVLAVWLEHRFTKDQLLGIYLNRVYFGAGAYGVDAASRRYFGKSARRLNVYECATIAGLLKAPSKFSPAGNRKLAGERASQVLANMVDAGYLTQAQAEAAAKESTVLAMVPTTQPGMRYFADWVEDQTAAGGYNGDLVVTTTLDPHMQAAAEQAIEAVLARDGPKAEASQGALVAMSPDGAIRAMVGGRDYRNSQFNRVTQAQRQPGSAFKPFVYLAALEHGMQPTDRFMDGPFRVGDWQPHNYSNNYLGEVTMAEAVAESINTVAVQVGQRAGMRNVVAVAHRLGITTDLSPDPSLALGTGEVTLLDLTSAYCAFASGGNGAWPYAIANIRDGRGKVLFSRQGGGPGRVIEPAYAAEINEMLAGVIAHGTGKAAQIGRPEAGKTGTTSDFRDALFVGYTSDLVAGVWFGNDDDTPMNHVSGGTLPARAWRDFMLGALKGRPARPLPRAEPPIDDSFLAVLKRAQQGLSGAQPTPEVDP